jgi:hypothetical protein
MPRGAIAPALAYRLGSLEEVDNLADLELRTVIPRYIGKRCAGALLVEDFRLGSANAKHSLHAAGGSLRQAPPQIAENDEGEKQDQPGKHFGSK